MEKKETAAPSEPKDEKKPKEVSAENSRTNAMGRGRDAGPFPGVKTR
jgi:hypothetical protein